MRNIQFAFLNQAAPVEELLRQCQDLVDHLPSYETCNLVAAMKVFESTSVMQHESDQARDISKQEEREIFPGAMFFKIIHIMMQDVVGNYDDPNDVPEWGWVEAHASYTHVHNGFDGIWEFVLNLDYVTNEPDAFNNIPPRLESIIRMAQAAGVAFIIFHQGT